MTLDRYNRQVLLPCIGEEGQRRIGAATAIVAGCGALGTVSAAVLARAGVGRLRLIDRDCVELTNLQRQTLFDEQDVKDGLPKAVAAERKLRAVNSEIVIEGLVADLHPGNAVDLLRGATVVVDGTDNFETRYLLNDVCVKLNLPWIYGAAVGTAGLALSIVPGRTPCLRCLFESAPPPGAAPTCETAGVLGAVTGLIGNHQAAEALKVCAGRLEALQTRLLSVDVWTGEYRQLDVSATRAAADCPCCGQRRFEYLEGRAAAPATRLCGQHAVLIRPAGVQVDVGTLARALTGTAGVAVLAANPFLVKFRAPGGAEVGRELELTVFADARAIVHGTRDPAVARALYAKYVGT